jgi:hypothetical protein
MEDQKNNGQKSESVEQTPIKESTTRKRFHEVIEKMDHFLSEMTIPRWIVRFFHWIQKLAFLALILIPTGMYFGYCITQYHYKNWMDDTINVRIFTWKENIYVISESSLRKVITTDNPLIPDLFPKKKDQPLKPEIKPEVKLEPQPQPQIQLQQKEKEKKKK